MQACTQDFDLVLQLEPRSAPALLGKARVLLQLRQQQVRRVAPHPEHACTHATMLLKPPLQEAERLLQQTCEAYTPGAVATILEARKLLEGLTAPAGAATGGASEAAAPRTAQVMVGRWEVQHS